MKTKKKGQKKAAAKAAPKGQSNGGATMSAEPGADAAKEAKGGYLIRAIRIKPEALAAAKEYKKAGGPSFYKLGEDAITERLVKEGFLKAAASK
jgi:hypothetical protein